MSKAGDFTQKAKSRLPIFLPGDYEGMKSICATLTDTIKEACEIIDSYEQQPTVGKFTKEFRKLIESPLTTLKLKRWYTKSRKACEIIDRAESELKAKDEIIFAYESVHAPINPLLAINKELLKALEQIRDLETECCPRCEGNGRLYADGKGHLMSENADTILCGNCGGSGRILPENAQDIAEAAIAKAIPPQS